MRRSDIRHVPPLPFRNTGEIFAIARSRNSLSIRNRYRGFAINSRFLGRITRALLRELPGKEMFDLSVHLVDTPEITHLNKQFLRHDGSTDVITFDYCDAATPEWLSGEIFICANEAVKQARRFRTSWQCELVRYVVHGILHLCGYDDRTARARKEMKLEEDRLVKGLTERFEVRRLGSSKARGLGGF